MIAGIVGSEAAKFTLQTERAAKAIIRAILTQPGITAYCSGHCHLGGIDIWAEQEGDKLGLQAYIFPPSKFSWAGGYKARNIQIAKTSDEVHCITLRTLPPHYTGMRFPLCYHCKSKTHVKSGGCWTMHYAKSLGKNGYLHIV